ncbi:hypothetical protein WKW77_34490 [Variovorax ureilyticus]|uniref:Uncharacterized protein n=1 Tax=Variovorax ureilyticus TaxID=1836198 RepID=A0ABU8VRB3_9BURK
MRSMVPERPASHHWHKCCQPAQARRRSHARDDFHLGQSFPWQADHQGIELRLSAPVENPQVGSIQPALTAARRQGCDVAVLNPDADTLSGRNGLDWQVSAAVGLPALVRTLDH